MEKVNKNMMKENRLYVKAKKCEFHASSVSFLGYILARGQVKTDPVKIKAVVEWPIPDSRRKLQQFLGFANFYRRFVRNYSQVAAPLTRLTSSKVPFIWSPEAHPAFTTLKQLFTSAPILIHPATSKQFIVEVDASNVGVGAVLSKRCGPQGKFSPTPISFDAFLPPNRIMM